MEGYSFGTFLVDDANREAFQLCREVANLGPVSPMPVVLLGDTCAGKTHLLYAVVNRTRAASASTGIAYITANDFPDSVRALIDDSRALEEAEHAILLVDNLESFSEDLDAVEGLARLFLDNEYAVIFASSVHPSRLTKLPAGLAAMVGEGSIVEILPEESAKRIDVVGRRERKEREATIVSQRKEIADLNARIGHMESGVSVPLAPPRSVPGNDDDRGADLADAQSALDSLGAELKEARAQEKQSRDDALEMVRRAERLLDETEESRAAFEQARGEQLEQLEEIRQLESAFAPSNDAAEGQGSGDGPANLRMERDALRGEIEDVRGECERLEGTIAQAHSERDESVGRVVDLERDIAELKARLDAVCVDSAEQVAAADRQTAELRDTLHDVRNELTGRLLEREVARLELVRLRDQCQSSATTAQGLLSLFGVESVEAPTEEAEAEVAEDERAEPTAPDEDAEAEETISEDAVPEDLPDNVIRTPGFGEPLQVPDRSSMRHVEELRRDIDLLSQDPPEENQSHRSA